MPYLDDWRTLLTSSKYKRIRRKIPLIRSAHCAKMAKHKRTIFAIQANYTFLEQPANAFLRHTPPSAGICTSSPQILTPEASDHH